MLPSEREPEVISISGTRERTDARHDGTHFDLDRPLAGVDVGLSLNDCWLCATMGAHAHMYRIVSYPNITLLM